jgi:putative radical SAM enzyme (TIGR03279 family)
MVVITGVLPHSKAEKAGIQAGDYLLEINSHEINDVLDYRFRLADTTVVLKLHRGPDIIEKKIKKEEYDDIGLEFGTPLMDKKHRCENGCIFCFIDQNPEGMRETIYFKDDDSRLAFLHGNYITLTNLHQADIDRIIEMHISPVNISVHTTNPELRIKIMKNKRSGEVLSYIGMLADAGIKLHGQIVLCRGINDGKELDRTMRDLSAYYPSMESVSIVPAGLTKYRDKLYKLEPFSAEECAAVINQVENFNKTLPERMFFASDEFYVLSGTKVPDEDYYGEYTQLDNGVGMITSFTAEFESMLETLDEDECSVKCEVSIATGESAYQMMRGLIDELEKKCPDLKCNLHVIKNNFFGGQVTVTGLLTGIDIAEQLHGKALGDTLYLSRTTLRAEGDLFLCGMSPNELSEKLGGVNIEFVENDGASLVEKLLRL